MKELAIGEILTIRIKCVEDRGLGPGCQTCVAKYYDLCYKMVCSRNHRKDGKNVHFELVEEKK